MPSKLSHLSLFVFASLVAVLVSWAALEHLAVGIPVAAAQAPALAPPPALPDPLDRPVEFWDQLEPLREYGGLYVVILLVVSAVSSSLARRFRPDQGAPPAAGWRARAITVLSTVGVLSAALIDLLAGGLTGGGFVVAAAGGAVALRDPRDKPKPAVGEPKTSETLAMLVLGSLLLSGCATARSAGGAGAAAGLDCTAPALRETVDEAAVLARAFVLSKISGAGEVDGDALRAAARQLQSEALRCSLVAAIAAIAALAEEPQPAVPRLMAAPAPADVLRGLSRQIVAEDWGIRGPLMLPAQ